MTLQLPADWTENQVREWLLTLASTGRSELPLPSGMTVPALVKIMFERAPADRRERLKTGLVLALQEWQYGAHRYPALEALSQIAALIRATAVIPRLAELVRRECALKRPDPQRGDALAAGAACLRGFAPAADLDVWLRVLFYDPDIEPSLSGLLFVGLCKGRPDTMSLHAPRFLSLRALVPHGFADIGHALLDAVQPVILITQFRQMPEDARESVAGLLRDVPDSQLLFTLGDRGVELAWLHQPSTTVVIGRSPQALADEYTRSTPIFSEPQMTRQLQRWLN